MNSKFMMEDHKQTSKIEHVKPCLVSLAGGDETQKAATRLLLPMESKSIPWTHAEVSDPDFSG